MEFKDYYQTLGLDKTATADDIKKAYRKLARKYHPDVSKESDAQQRMREVNEANEVLGDPEKRAAYDQLDQQHRDGQDFQPPPGWDAGFESSGHGFGGAGADQFSDFFANMFGQAGRGGRASQSSHTYQMRGEDRHAKVSIDLADAYHGATRKFTLQSPEVDAQGRVVTREHILSVKIPKGVKEGQHIRLTRQGSPGVGGGPPGDLYLAVHFTADALYRVEGRNVHVSLPVTPWEAALGATVEVPTPSGPVKLKVPEGSQTGRRLRLKGRGIPGAEAGDLYVALEVVLPAADSDKARELYETMARELAFDPRQRMEAKR